MSEKRFKLDVRMDMPKLLIDTATNERYNLLLVNDIVDIVDLLNEQESTITPLKERNKQLRRRLEKINGGYGHLTHRNGLTANEWVIELQEKELKKKNEQISDWIERHSKDIVKIGEQQALISEQQNTIDILLECLYVAQDTVINEYSSHIAEDMEKLEKIFKDRDIGEIRKFVLGADEDESE